MVCGCAASSDHGDDPPSPTIVGNGLPSRVDRFQGVRQGGAALLSSFRPDKWQPADHRRSPWRRDCCSREARGLVRGLISPPEWFAVRSSRSTDKQVAGRLIETFVAKTFVACGSSNSDLATSSPPASCSARPPRPCTLAAASGPSRSPHCGSACLPVYPTSELRISRVVKQKYRGSLVV